MDSDKEKALEEMSKFAKEFTKAANDYQEECDALWNSLPYDDKLKLFCAVSSLIFKGEIEEKGTYRHVLYDTFQFGPDSYAVAQHAGYLSIHNAIFDGENIKETIKDFVENHMDITDGNLDQQLNKFILKKYL
jgi:hypothetical protein